LTFFRLIGRSGTDHAKFVVRKEISNTWGLKIGFMLFFQLHFSDLTIKLHRIYLFEILRVLRAFQVGF